MNRNKTITIVNRGYVHPRSIIGVFDRRLTQLQFDQGAFDDVTNPGFDSEEIGGHAIPPNVTLVSQISGTTTDTVAIGNTVEETLDEQDGMYFTTFPVNFFRKVWYDGIMANYLEQWTLSGTNALVPNYPLIDGTEVIGRYVIA